MTANKHKDEENLKNPDNEGDIILEPTEEETGEENLRQKLKDLRSKLAECSKEKSDYLSGWQRAKADYINLQKEGENRRKENVQFAGERIILDVLPILDSFEMAIANKETWNSVPETWRTGIEYIKGQFDSVLTNHGLSEICPKEKDNIKFEYHAVVETVPTENKDEDGKISSVIQKGYMLNGKVLRPAKVIAFLYSNRK